MKTHNVISSQKNKNEIALLDDAISKLYSLSRKPNKIKNKLLLH
jgi:hypothetical protein